MSPNPLEAILHPESIAIAGASETGDGGRFILSLVKLGFKGKIYPVHPKYQEVLGFKCYPSVRDIPGNVDFVISSIPAAQVLNLLDDCSVKGVKCIHFFTARLAETGRQDAIELEKEMLIKARAAGIRMIGPNCMGVYHPAWGLAWNPGMSNVPGPMGLISQSGALAFELIETAGARGMHYSKGISYGNAVDFNECDYLEYFAQDDETKLVVIYIEGVRDGKRFLDILQRTTAKKPVIILKGGRGKSGTRATASHTASLAGSAEVWKTAMKQTGAVTVSDIEELIDVAAAFYFLPPANGTHVGVAGGGGGGSVLAADLCEEAGLEVIPLPVEIREELKKQGNPVWDWISNPADFSILPGGAGADTIAKMMASHPDIDLNIVFIVPRGSRGPLTVESLITQFTFDDMKIKPLLAILYDRSSGEKDPTGRITGIFNDFKNRLTEKHIPVYPNITRAANAAAKMVNYYRHRT